MLAALQVTSRSEVTCAPATDLPTTLDKGLRG